MARLGVFLDFSFHTQFDRRSVHHWVNRVLWILLFLQKDGGYRLVA